MRVFEDSDPNDAMTSGEILRARESRPSDHHNEGGMLDLTEGASIGPNTIIDLATSKEEESKKESENNWETSASCLGMGKRIFYPEKGESTREAKEICRDCIVKEECLEFALGNREKFGVWGGKSERERRKIRLNRSLAAAAVALKNL